MGGRYLQSLRYCSKLFHRNDGGQHARQFWLSFPYSEPSRALSSDSEMLDGLGRITVLTTTQCKTLAKSFTKIKKNGFTKKDDFHPGEWFRADEKEINGVKAYSDFAFQIQNNRSKGVIPDELIDRSDLQNEVRKNANPDAKGKGHFREPARGRHLVCLDSDDIKCPPHCVTLEEKYQHALSKLPSDFQNRSHHFQWSGTAGVYCPKNPELNGWDKIKCHFWFWLAEPRSNHDIKQWIEHNQLSFDKSMFKLVQLHITANPVFNGEAVDPIPENERSRFVQGKYDKAYIPVAPLHTYLEKPVSTFTDVEKHWFGIDDDGVPDRLVTKQGRDAADEIARDREVKSEFLKPIADLLMACRNNKNGTVWTKKTVWDHSTKNIHWFYILSPFFLERFKNPVFLGDDFDNSPFFKCWQDRFNVNWVKKEILHKRLPREVQTSLRLHHGYFSDRPASFNFFNEHKKNKTAQNVLKDVAKYVHKHFSFAEFYWTTNERLRKIMCQYLDQEQYISPRATGDNTRSKIEFCLFAAAMKPSKHESNLWQEVYGITRQELVDFREGNAVIQFISRGVIRNFDGVDGSKEQFCFYFSKEQAEIAQQRYGGTIEKIDGVVLKDSFGKQPFFQRPMAKKENMQLGRLIKNMINGKMNVDQVISKMNEQYGLIVRDEEALCAHVINKIKESHTESY